MNGTIVTSLVLYYVVVLGIGVWVMRKGVGKNLEGYLLGGRKVGPLVTALTLQSTSMSGFMFLGAGALGYAEGYWALWYAAGDIGGGVVNLSVIGRRMQKLSQLTGSLTPIEYLEKRYPSPCGFRGKPIGIPGRCRSRFRDEADQRSDAMPISDRAFSES